MNRRELLSAVALATVASTLPSLAQATSAAPAAPAPAKDEPTGPHSVPPLAFAPEALEPHIDALTMTIHHDRHHATYVKNLNKALVGQPDALVKKSARELVQDLASVPEAIRTVVRNNAGGHVNHTLFWETLSPKGGGAPTGDLAKAIDKSFGSYAEFQKKLSEAATKVFGSGWAWLSLNEKKELVVESTPNQDSPLSLGHEPLLGLDVWEHAYYLKHQNKRVDYIAAWWNVVNWSAVATTYAKASK
jgi:Fe-Mn family superoxide dismutase